MPVKAEEGISGVLQANDRPMIPVKDRIGGYPSSSAIDDLDLSQQELADLDTEGRTTVVDMGLFVLINVYCPNQTNEERLMFKMAFSQVLEMRIRALVAAGREVILVGDINVVATELDHCDPSHSGGPDGYMDTLPRKWFQRLIGPGGPLTDVTRRFHPDRAGMFTCWETRINAREGNYGTRLDYICVTPALLPWIKGSDIMNTVKGSDHCPVYVDFFDQRTLDDGTTVDLWPLINPPNRSRDETPEAPAFSARNYQEFKVRNLSSMWSKQPKPSPSPSPALPAPTLQTPVSSPEDELSVDAALAKLHTIPVEAESSSQLKPSTYIPEASSSKLPAPKSESRPPLQPSSQKSSSKSVSTTKASSNAKGKSPTVEQSSISSFFAPPPKPEKKKKKKKRKASDEEQEVSTAKKVKSHEVVDISGDDEVPTSSGVRASQEDRLDEVDAVAVVNSAEAWSAIFKKTEAPLCFHNEPCKEWLTNKPGPNKGRKFWLCQRPVGEGRFFPQSDEFSSN